MVMPGMLSWLRQQTRFKRSTSGMLPRKRSSLERGRNRPLSGRPEKAQRQNPGDEEEDGGRPPDPRGAPWLKDVEGRLVPLS